MGSRRFVPMLAVALLVAGCTEAPAEEVEGDADPQVLQDVISTAFMVPGPDMARSRRVNAFPWDSGSPSAAANRLPLT